MRYALTIKERVQNMGYRNFIEKSAKVRRLKGYVFNDINGTVRLVCEGSQEKIDDFIDAINLHEEEIFVEDIVKDEIDKVFPIPETFARIETDTLDDISRKLDKGVDLLKDMKGDTRVLHEHTGLLKDLKDGQNKMIEILDKIAEK